MTRERLNQIVFGTDTKAGKQFDIFLLCIILFSVLVVMLESVPEIGSSYRDQFFSIEWALTIIFSIEYVVRLLISPKPLKYVFSLWGLIDLLSILPSYIGLFIAGYHYFIIVRIFRLLRVFRILKLARFNSESSVLIAALASSMHKLSIFFITVVTIVVFMGTLMYVVEGGEKGFTSIPQTIYWAVVTVTTVGYGDMVPQTALGKFISSIAMITGYAIIAVPTGIITVEMSKSINRKNICLKCKYPNEITANFCNNCGQTIDS